MTRGKTFIVSGPSGVGKSTVLKALMEKRKNLYFSISATTREARPGEIDGVHYHFISVDDFRDWISRDEFLEYAEYVGNFYGTPKKYVDAAMDRGDDVILDIEVQGTLQVCAKRPETVRIFIAPPPGRSWSAGSPAGAPTRRRTSRAACSGPRWSSRPPTPMTTSSSTTAWRTPSGSWTPSSRRSTASPPTGWRSSGESKPKNQENSGVFTPRTRRERSLWISIPRKRECSIRPWAVSPPMCPTATSL